MNRALEEKVQELENRIEKLEKSSESPNLNENLKKPKAVTEFKQDFDPETYADKSAIIGKYLEEHKNLDGFTTEDLNKYFKRCKWKPPANASDIVSKAAGKGLFMKIGEQDGKKKWMLTETGEEHVEDLKV